MKRRPVHQAFVEQEPKEVPWTDGAPFYAMCSETLEQTRIGAWSCTKRPNGVTAIDVALERLNHDCPDAEHVL